MHGASTRLAVVSRLLQALADSDRQAFCDAFDAQLIRKSHDSFKPHRDKLVEWTTAEMLATRVIGMKESLATRSIVPLDTAGSSSAYGGRGLALNSRRSASSDLRTALRSPRWIHGS